MSSLLDPTQVMVRVDQLVGCGDPDQAAITVKSGTLTYGELTERVARIAAGLAEIGIRRGDRVVIYAEKRVETVIAILATAMTGAVFVPVNPLFKARHLAHVLSDCAPRLVVTTAPRLATVRRALSPDIEGPRVVVVDDADPARSTAATVADDGDEVMGWSELDRTNGGPPPERDAVIDGDIAAIFYTSGSTGGPKGVVLSHRNILAGAASVATYLGHSREDTILGVLPLSFDAGFSQLTTTLLAGGHLVLTNYLMPRDVIRLCTAHGVTGLTCVPPLWIQLAAQQWPTEATERLRYFANTGGRLPRATLTTLRGLFPHAKPYLMYGLTEAFRSTYLDPSEVDHRPDSIGKAIPNAEVLVVRPDGSRCAPGEHGELVHRGALVSLGYWNDPERTARRFRPLPGGNPAVRPEVAVWSGDTVYQDEDGFLYFVGRSDEMIKTSGYRVSPTEIEEAAYGTGLVREVVALGVGDERLGQRIVLAVGGDCDVESLRMALAHELPTYMLPQDVTVFAQLPRSANGKFDRVKLRQLVEGRK